MDKSSDFRVAPHPPIPKYYVSDSQRRSFVSGIFDQTAASYDWIDRVMSFGSGVRYRRDALRRGGLKPGDNVLDVAVGTGLLSRAACEVLGNTGHISGVDLSIGMLTEARKTLPISLVQGIAEELPITDSSADFVTMGYALRHVADLQCTFAEFARVLKPGGKLLILELTRPEPGSLTYQLTRFYLRNVVPSVARLSKGGADSKKLMEYFWDTIDQCVPPSTILESLSNCGLNSPRRKISHAIFSEYMATKPDD